MKCVNVCKMCDPKGDQKKIDITNITIKYNYKI